MNIEKAYNPAKYEDETYKKWERSGYFNPDKLPGKRPKKFSMVMPPPNVTGVLHVGHAVMLALEDLMARFYRMRGFGALWIPGTDHAAIATQAKVEKILREKGETRQSLGKEEFLKEVRKFAGQSKDTIHKQIRKMGCSCDWSREAYTLDEERTLAVRTVFKKMYDDGLIYRGDRVVNWCPRCGSTLADDEVEYVEQDAKLYTFKYDEDFPFEISTTRPETKLGDTAVAVNPKDQRYKKYIGKEFDADFVGKRLHIKIIADNSVDIEFGTGALGVTPAHSLADWQMAQKNNLEIVKIIGEDGKITAAAGKFFGLTALEARERILKSLEKKGLLGKTANIKNNLSVCYRCGEPIEPLPSKQWFINVNKKITVKGNKYFKNKSLKEVSAQVVGSGEIKIMPERFLKVYLHWMENLRDWCISRQIWFGHQIPVWHKDGLARRPVSSGSMSGAIAEGKEYVGIKEPKGAGWEQDSDTLDTWFSSGLWTFSTLGWPAAVKILAGKPTKIKDLKKYHPTTVLETGYDILPFWVARMILMTTYVLGDIPFKNIYLHGLVRDEKGRKMSKSLGNVIDPSETSEKYGTDAVRLSLIMGTSPGNDITISEEKIASFRNFANKLWNISRYITLNPKSEIRNPKQETLADKWIISKFNKLILEITKDLENYNFGIAGEKLRDFTWGDFADWYLEISKVESGKEKILKEILEKILVLWHPFIPFVTDVIWREFLKKRNLIIADWPEADAKKIDEKAEKDFAVVQEIVQKIRNLRAESKIEPSLKINVLLISRRTDLLESQAEIIKRLAGVDTLKIQESGERTEGSPSGPRDYIGSVAEGTGIYIKSAGEINVTKDQARISKEIEEKERYLKILEGKLSNPEFVKKAPPKVIKDEREKKEKILEDIKNLKEQLK